MSPGQSLYNAMRITINRLEMNNDNRINNPILYYTIINIYNIIQVIYIYTTYVSIIYSSIYIYYNVIYTFEVRLWVINRLPPRVVVVQHGGGQVRDRLELVHVVTCIYIHSVQYIHSIQCMYSLYYVYSM